MNTFLSKLTIVLFLISFLNLPAQVKTKELKAKDIPTDIKYEGTLKKAIQWEDKAGYHIVILAETGIYINKDLPHESEGRDAELYAYHFLDAEDLIVQVWKVFDYIHDCELDIEASFIENTLAVTDLNKDESPEIWIMYKKVCHGDVSPSEMKIIMYENAKKYAMRGEIKYNMEMMMLLVANISWINHLKRDLLFLEHSQLNFGIKIFFRNGTETEYKKIERLKFKHGVYN